MGYPLLILSILCIVRAARLGQSRLTGLAVSVAAVLLSLKVLDVLCAEPFISWWQGDDVRRSLEADARFAAEHERRAQGHPFHFNDRWPVPPAPKRIVVLGDSFVFGSGLDESERWSRKLERRIAPEVQVLHFGRNGWSTKDELAFLEERWPEDLRTDLLLVGFVTNDVMLEPDAFTFPASTIYAASGPISDLIPAFRREAVLLTAPIGYAARLDTLYGADNLDRYDGVLAGMRRWSTHRGIEVRFVITPNACDESTKSHVAAVTARLERAGFPVLDLLPDLCACASRLDRTKLTASLTDWHPGPALTELFARRTAEYLRRVRPDLTELVTEAPAGECGSR